MDKGEKRDGRERGGDAGETHISPFLEVNLGEDKGPEREKGRALALDKQTREKGDWSGTKEGSTVGVSCVIAVHCSGGIT